MTQPGFWNSPISSEMLTKTGFRAGNIQVLGKTVYWTESSSETENMVVLRSWNQSSGILNVIEGYNIRTRVHEYGGQCFAVSEEYLYFVHDENGCIYKKDFITGEVRKLTLKGPRFADLQITDEGLVAVGEEDRKDQEPENFLALIDTQTGNVEKIHKGYDFYAAPSFHKSTSTLCWLSWNHPNMPWDQTELWVGQLIEGALIGTECVRGQLEEEAIFQPQWCEDGSLYFVSDKEEFWNLYAFEESREPKSIVTGAFECAWPMWVFGMSTWAFAGKNIFSAANVGGFWTLRRRDQFGEVIEIELPYTAIDQVRASESIVAFWAASETEENQLVILDPDTLYYKAIRTNEPLPFSTDYISLPQCIKFNSNGRNAYANFYPPTNPEYNSKTAFPLLVKSHGGPTASADPDFQLKVQFWTSRGFGLVDVNYAGSTGFGRSYRHSLDGEWGVYDMQDCVAAVDFLQETENIDTNSIFISGGSAGGLTTLCCLAFTNRFSGGASYYGVADLVGLAEETHKFEARYLDRLVGKYPEEIDTYKARSPLYNAEKINCPVIFFQGLQDKVVPPSQPEAMILELHRNKVPLKYITFDDESHGFRKAANIKTALEQEFAFYQKIIIG